MKRLVCAFILALTPLHQAYAWGSEGHSIVAEIAQRRLTPAAAAKVRDILGGNISLASIAAWADDVRGPRPHTYNWHFTDIPLSETNYVPARDCADSQKGDCAINAITRSKGKLADNGASAADRKEALMFLVHFVGDLHQPLHTVKDYKGGNGLRVSFFVDPLKKKLEKTNLHVVWDTYVIRATAYDWGSYVTLLEINWLPGKDAVSLSGGSPIDWALQAHQAAIDVAFEGISMDEELGEDYLLAARPIVDQQLALAGLRLARLINEALP
jgi:hypothetical protein